MVGAGAVLENLECLLAGMAIHPADEAREPQVGGSTGEEQGREEGGTSLRPVVTGLCASGAPLCRGHHRTRHVDGAIPRRRGAQR